jgi:5-methyltetrahydrofolate corrinoid/iron sulfur protein methyltransferase
MSTRALSSDVIVDVLLGCPVRRHQVQYHEERTKMTATEGERLFLAADNLHGLNPLVRECMQKLDPGPIQDLARQCEQAGALFIDLNPGYLSRRNEDRMAFLVEAVQEAVSLGLILDSPNPRVLAAGLSVCRGTPILNALSLEEEKLNGILPLAAEYKTELVLLIMDQRSITPPELEEKLAIAIELRERCLCVGLSHEDLIFDPVLPNLSWPDAYSRVGEDIRAVRLLASGAVFQEPCRTMVGLSNLRSGAKQRFPVALEKTCLSLLAGAGLTLALADVFQKDIMAEFHQINQMM